MRSPAQEIKEAREHLGLTQAQYAQLTGHAQGTVSKWEKGIWTPDDFTLALASAFQRSKARRAGRMLATKGPLYCLITVFRRIPSL